MGKSTISLKRSRYNLQKLSITIHNCKGQVDVSEAMDRGDLESVDYSPVVHLTQLFESPSLLLELDDLVQYTRSYRKSLDRYIETERDEYNKGVGETKDTLLSIEKDLDTAVAEIETTRQLARSTEKTINSMTYNIKKLDNCKKNITLSMTILKRLQMLITSYNNVEHIIYNSNVKNYYEIYQLLSVVIELMDHFQSYKSIDDINNLNRKITELKAKIVDEIFNDFGKEINEGYSNMELMNACKILDLLGVSYRDKLINWFISNQLKEIQSIFRSTEEAGSLENLNRRFIFFKRVFKTVEQRYSSKFPEDWKILQKLCDKFCEITKLDLREVLLKESKTIGVNLLLTALSETLEFENFLNMKFKAHNSSKPADSEVVFDNTISSVFEPYLDIWLEFQDKTINDKFLEFMNPAKLLENKDSGNQEENNDTLNILDSSADLFRIYRSLLSQLSKLSTTEPLLKLSMIFVKYLNKYNEMVLQPILPEFDVIKGNSDTENEKVVNYATLVLNTTDYCSLTIVQLQERLVASMSENLIPRMEQSFERVKESFTALMNRCLNLLCFKLSEELSLQWRTMINLNWKNLNSVDDTSNYVYGINKIINENVTSVFTKINRSIYLKTFMNKIVELISYSFFINVVKLKPITEVMSEQLLLDLRSLKDNLNSLPDLYQHHEEVLGSKYYTNFVNLTTGNIETVLRVLLMEVKPIETFATNYFYVVGDRNFNNFVKILKLKGILPTTGGHHAPHFNDSGVSRYKKIFDSQLNKYEDTMIDADDNHELNAKTNKPLVESFKFLENINIDAIDYNSENVPAWLSGSNTAEIANSVRPNSPQQKNNFTLSSPFNNNSKLINTRDQMEKNITKTMDNFKINDNFKNLNLGKLFKRADN